MSDQINIKVVCETHPNEQLDVAAERHGGHYEIQLSVSTCTQCLADAVKEADPIDLPAKSAELVFNDAVMTLMTIEV